MNGLKRVLLVDDSEKDVELALEALAENNLCNEVVVARDGAEALDYLHRRGEFGTRADGNPVVVLLDIKMPKVDGLQVLREMRSDPGLKHVPVVMLTSSREERDLMESYRLGVNAYVVKPVDFPQFVDAVKQIGAFWAVVNQPPPASVSNRIEKLLTKREVGNIIKKTLRILHLEDNRGDAEIVESMLAEADIGCELVRVDNRTDFQEALARGGFDLILSDYSLPDFDGAAALAVAREKHPQVPFIFVSGALGEELAIESLKSGATDYVLKHRLSRLVPAVQRALQEAEERSNRRLLEEQLRQAQKVEAIGQLAGGVAHDFNNILTAITAYSEGMIKQLPPNHQLHKSALEINKAAARAASLTRQLLVFSRKQVLQPKVVDLNALVADVEKMLGRVIGENIQLNCQLGSALGHVKADPGHLQQVIMNLAVNARDAMPNGGTLTIQTANAAVDETYARQHVGLTAGDYVTLAVTDTGTGMTEQVKAHLFEPFFTTKGVGKGTGLGLATCFGIVQQSGGHISVQSQVGQGTTFRIYLPRVEAVAESLPKRVEFSDLPTGDETVLLVEDEPVVREVASAALRDLGYSVLEASNGEEALNVVQKQDGRDIHLLLTDMVMPVMGGKELADWLRGAYPQVKVLFTSGYTEDALRDQGVPHADLALLEKPFTSVTLANKVRQVLDKGA